MSEGTWLDRFDARMNAVRAYVAQRGPGPSLELLGTLRRAEGAIAGFADHVEHDLGRARDAISVDVNSGNLARARSVAQWDDGRYTVRAVFRYRWNRPGLPGSPSDVVPNLWPEGRDENGDVVYRWRASEEMMRSAGEAGQQGVARDVTLRATQREPSRRRRVP